MTVRHSLIAAALVSLFPASTTAQDLASLLTKLRNATAYLEVHFVDANNPNNRCPSGPNEGTGFVVSANGGLITAQHIFERKPECSAYGDTHVEARLGYRATAFPTPTIPVVIDANADIVAARLGDKLGGYEHLDVCFVDRPKQGTSLLALGFPVGQDFTALEVVFQNPNRATARWNVSSEIAFGMSGGPIVDLSGRVIGVIKGGVPNTPAARFVTPLNWAQGPLTAAGVLNVATCGEIPTSIPATEYTTAPPPQDEVKTYMISARVKAAIREREIVEASFGHEFSNEASCTEGWRTQSFPACLPGVTKIKQVLGPQVNSAGHDGQSWYEPDPARGNCVNLIYGYSDRGRDLIGNCRGNGWISADWVLQGERVGPLLDFSDVAEEVLEYINGNEATATITIPAALREEIAAATETNWSYRVEIHDNTGELVAELSDSASSLGDFRSEQTSIGTVIVSIGP